MVFALDASPLSHVDVEFYVAGIVCPKRANVEDPAAFVKPDSTPICRNVKQ